MLCPKCQNNIPEGAVFCPSCGSPVVQEPINPQPVVGSTIPGVNSVQQQQPQGVPSYPSESASFNQDSKPNSKKIFIIVGAIVGGLILLSGIAFGANYYIKQAALKKTDDQLNEIAKTFGDDDSEGDEQASVKNPTDAYNIAKSKITFTNPGVTIIKIVGKEDYSKISYYFEFIDRDSLYKDKDGYYYFKGKNVTVTGTGDVHEEDDDSNFAGSKSTEFKDFGNNKMTDGRIEEVLAAGKKALLAKKYKLGSVIGLFFTDDQSNSYGSRDKWEVYYSATGQDETSEGFRTLKAYVVELEQPVLKVLRSGSAELSMNFTDF